jgi:hypothetical protein
LASQIHQFQWNQNNVSAVALQHHITIIIAFPFTIAFATVNFLRIAIILAMHYIIVNVAFLAHHS